MNDEMDALIHNNTQDLVALPQDKNVIGCKNSMYKVKHKSNRSVESYKARLVDKGQRYKEGLDYHESFALIVKPILVHYFLALASIKRWKLHELDVHNMFPHGNLSKEMYIHILQEENQVYKT